MQTSEWQGTRLGFPPCIRKKETRKGEKTSCSLALSEPFTDCSINYLSFIWPQRREWPSLMVKGKGQHVCTVCTITMQRRYRAILSVTHAGLSLCTQEIQVLPWTWQNHMSNQYWIAQTENGKSILDVTWSFFPPPIHFSRHKNTVAERSDALGETCLDEVCLGGM